MSRIFISHSSQDNAAALAMRDWLVAEGWDDLFLDLDPKRGIAAGERWERALNDAANRCEAVIFLVSQVWLNSPWCVKEFHLADKLNKRMFGVLIEDIPISDLPADMTGDWQLVNLAAGRDHMTFRSVTLAGEREEHVTFSASGLARLKAGLNKAGLDARFFAWPPEGDPDRSPYRGLKALEAEDAGIFFGREAPTVAAIDRLRGLASGMSPQLMVILGASGAGKSSFLRAGLLPRLTRDDRNFLTLPVLRPERAALSGATGLVQILDQAFAQRSFGIKRADVRAMIDAGAALLIAKLRALADAARVPEMPGEPPTPAPAIVLSIDQGEELFQAEGANEAQALFTLLQTLMTASDLRLIVLVTIRSDAYDRFQSVAALDGVRQETMSLPPLPKGAYQTVIEGPAARLNDTRHPLVVDPALTQGLLADIEAGGAKDALPLLAFTLERLYLDHGGDGDITLAEYTEIGGVKGSIEAAVERALSAAGADPRVPRDRDAKLLLLRRGLIPWLAGIDPETSTPRRRIARLVEIPAESRALIEHLVEARLLSIDVDVNSGVVVIEPAHEALLRQWTLLQGWLDEDYAALAALDGVKRAARDWAANDCDNDWLAHSAGRLEDARAFGNRTELRNYLDEADRRYLDACLDRDQAQRDRELSEALRLAEEQTKVAQAQRLVARRTGLGLIAASVMAIVAVGAAAYGFEQARIAASARDKAEQNFALARDTTKDIVLNLAHGLREVAGIRIDSVKKILDAAGKAMDKLTESDPDDPKLQRARLLMLNEFVATYYAQRDGDGREILKLAEQSAAIAHKLAADAPANIQAQRDLSECLGGVGNVALRTGETARAQSAFQEALEIGRRLAALDPNDLDNQLRIAVDLVGLANISQLKGDSRQASQDNQEALDIFRNIGKLKPDDDITQRNLSVHLEQIGAAELSAGNFAAAEAHLQESFDISRTLAERYPDNVPDQSNLAQALMGIGDLNLRLGKPEAALQSFQKDLDLAKKIATLDPGNPGLQREVAVAIQRIGDARDTLGDIPGTLEAYRQSLEVVRKMGALDPKGVEAQNDIAIGLARLGNVRVNDDQEDALKDFEEALAIRQALAQLYPDNVAVQHDVARSLNSIGDFRLATGDPKAALVIFEKGLEITRNLVAQDPLNMTIEQDLAEYLIRCGDARLATGDKAGSLDAYREALDISAKRVGTDLQWSRDKSRALHGKGRVLFATGDDIGAMQAFQEGLAIDRDRQKLEPKEWRIQRDIGLILFDIGDAQQRTGDVEAALSSFRESVDIGRHIVALGGEPPISKRNLSISLERIGDIDLGRDNLDDAAVVYQQELSITRDLLAGSPDGVQAMRDVARALNRLGHVRLKTKAWADSRVFFQQMLELCVAIVAKSPNDANDLVNLIYADQGLGYASEQMGDLSDAVTAYGRVPDLRISIAMLDPTKLELQRDVADSFEVCGSLQRKLKNAPEAIAAYQSAVDVRRRIAAASTAEPGDQAALATDLYNVGTLRLETKNPAAGLAAFDEIASMLKITDSSHPNNSNTLGNIALMREKSASIRAIAGENDAARAAYRDAVDARRRVDQLTPNDVVTLKALADDLDWIAQLSERLSDRQAALSAYSGELDVRRNLAALDPNDADKRFNVASTLNWIGHYSFGVSDMAGAETAFQEGLAIDRELATHFPSNAMISNEIASDLDGVADIRLVAGEGGAAQKAYQESADLRRTLSKLEPSDQKLQSDFIYTLQHLAWSALLNRQPEVCLAASEEEIALAGGDPKKLASRINRAHALMYLGRLDEARAAYLAGRGNLLADGEKWEDEIASDFSELSKSGLERPEMTEILEAISATRQ